MNKITFVEIREDHIPDLLSIYNHYVLSSTITFNTEPLSELEMKNLIMNHNSNRYKSFVILNHEFISGYILITQYKARQAYDNTAEITIYLKPEFIGQGLGKHSLQFIEGVAKDKGFHTLVAGLCTENERSRHLFEGNGYLKCAHFKEIGYKFGRFLDVEYFQKMI
ncbi:GNAT family N-acetyltransferase [Paenibacillus sp. sptzw28]|uniref:GNAT family N-acetyltransferase n=1 Tax=Paenibacillus sp. sptzw28 TaxID=715179 RepID=UPI001C6F1384|nr:GNAT family N-acetyltransferase [Paenibacillus sp. sptzw28]QYR19146.1 GNAT family N-acetyltransferase [Paenibacillus sp. sptzw28]